MSNQENRRSFRVSEDIYIKVDMLTQEEFQGGMEHYKLRRGINDGASAVLLCDEASLKKYNLTPMARVVSTAVAGVPPEIMGIGPVEAIPRALKQAGLAQGDIERYELPNLRALNFYIRGLLTTGAASNHRIDKQAKSLGEYLRAKHIEVPEVLAEGL